MGRNIYQVKYPCNDMCYYGSCSKTNAYIYIGYRGSDTFTLYHKHHLEDPKSELEYIDGGEDDVKVSALIKILTGKTDEMMEVDEAIRDEIRDKKII